MKSSDNNREALETSSRLHSEATFHDEAFQTQGRARAAKFYSVTARSRASYRHRLLTDIGGKRVLEYGCGQGSWAFEIARLGGRVTGIDISPVGIEMATARAEAEHLSDRAVFLVADAEHLPFTDASFDVVAGSGILHHLDLPVAYAEVARVLTDNGRAVFIEPLGHNPLINWYRERTPELRTRDEHPLREEDLEVARRYFRSFDVEYFHLASLGVVPLRATPLFQPLYRAAEALDVVLMAAIPPLRKWAWTVVIELRK